MKINYFIIHFVLVFFFVIAESLAGDLIFLKNGAEFKKVSLEKIKSIQPEQVMNVFEPQENKKKTYKGFSMVPLLNSFYGQTEVQKFDTVVFYCEDGYRSDVPIGEFIKKQSNLSFGVVGSSRFELKATEKKSIPLGPFYLTWDHPDAASAQKEFFRWPYGINKIDLIKKSQAYSAIEPPLNGPEPVKKGYEQYVKHCFSCHQLNEVGGLRGPPLNLFVSIRTREELVAYILNPKSKNKNSQMAGLPKDLKDRQEIAESIVDYLKSRAKK